MNPDLGMQYIREGYQRTTDLVFPGVAFSEVSFMSDVDCTVTLNTKYRESDYAVSFDFDRKILEGLLAKLEPWQRQLFVTSVNGRRMPFTAALPATVTAIVHCHLGEEVQVSKEKFIPFVISRIE